MKYNLDLTSRNKYLFVLRAFQLIRRNLAGGQTLLTFY